MTEILIALMTGIGAGIFFIIKENRELRKKEKLHDIEIEDVKLTNDLSNLQSDKSKIKNEMNKFQENPELLSDDEIEKFWNNRDKK